MELRYYRKNVFGNELMYITGKGKEQIERLTGKVEELQTQLALPAPKEEKRGFLGWLFGKIES